VALNLHWTWDSETIELFRRLDPDLWEQSGHNPMQLLAEAGFKRLKEAAADLGFMAHLERVCEQLQAYLAEERTWYSTTHADAIAGLPGQPVIAYFVMEFGLTECLPIYSGGLGVLSGDHLKTASDLGLPLVGIGLLYQEGYFRQRLNADGWQAEEYPLNDFYNLPLTPVERSKGVPLTVSVALPGRTVVAQVWRAQVGRVPLFLLDTNLPVNQQADRDITDRLYGGDLDMRIRQEIVLGIGGIRALEALGYNPVVVHMNEGHSAFSGLERIRLLIERHKLSFAEAREVAAAGNIFTTHTPVPAGIDIFPPEMIDAYFRGWYEPLGIGHQEFMALGRSDPRNQSEGFSMAVLAIRLAAYVNGVSRLHGRVARRMWHNLWPRVPQDEVPIAHITNGVHVPTWVGDELARLYDRYLGPRWRETPEDPQVWQEVGSIPDEELWRAHVRSREQLVRYVRQRLRTQMLRRGDSPAEVERAAEALNPEALTIGFARRFATYKRATLIFRDVERLVRLVGDQARPVQIIFAGKAHPHDNPGKEAIRFIVHTIRREELRGRIVFVEDYDLALARALMHGCDLWLTTPRRPLEASGTSGMKAAFNGVLQMSVLDGWWDEAYRPEIGWAIGQGEEYTDPEYQDYVESRAIYNLLENDVVPLFYERDRHGVPRGWVGRMKASIMALAPVFNTRRMLQEYAEQMYLPAARRVARLQEQEMARAKSLAAWRARLQAAWPNVRVLEVRSDLPAEATLDTEFEVRADIALGNLSPDDVQVELYHGPIGPTGAIVQPARTVMTAQLPQGSGVYTYATLLQCRASGLYGYTVRVLPAHPDLHNPLTLGLVQWAG
jgi:starch phosphorylase